MLFSFAKAQDLEQLRREKLDELELSGLGKTLLLNNAWTGQIEIDYFRTLAKNKIPKAELVSSEEWENLYERLIDADLAYPDKQMPALSKLIETDPNELTKSNVVPIGVMNLEGIYFTDTQIEDNKSKKKAGKKADFSSYEKIRIVYAAVLQEEVYQADISLQIRPELFIFNHQDSIKNIAIDFNDEKGYTTYPVTAHLIPHTFKNVGKQRINIKLITGGPTYIFETFVDVKQLERIKPYKEFRVTAQRITTDTARMEKAARTMLIGGEIRIISGCDQIFDKPIIIGEGFDIGQNISLDANEAKYRFPFRQYLSEGYDLVLINYDDGRAAIQDNAQVMKAVIQQVNAIKQGNHKNIVIGESMSGLVARWALREMENNGQPHNVNLLVCYDTPNQGANVPVGLTSLPYDLSATVLTQVVLKFFAKGWRNFYSALATPAAKQMMIHQAGYPNIGGKHQDYDAFRTSLIALGNGGYPQNCRNIAMIHASLDASDRAIFENYNYGFRIFRSFTPWLLQNTNIEVNTNKINQFDTVLRLGAWGILFKAVGINRKYTSPFNDDFLPGGLTTFSVPNKLIHPTREFRFCFLPSFSSIDYQGAISSQNQRELLNVTTVNAVVGPGRQTPFAAIYGRIDNQNSFHAQPGFVDWLPLGLAEGLLTNIPACPALPVPPTPNIITTNTCYPFSEKRTTEDNTANITVSLSTPSNGLYIHNWTVLPTQQTFTTTGDQITFQAEKAGTYQIVCVRTYPNRRDLQSSHTASIFVSNCGDISAGPEFPDSSLVSASDVDVTDIWEGDFLLTTPKPDSLAVFAHYTAGDPGALYATTQNNVFVPRAKLIESGMFEAFAELFPETDPRIALPVVLSAFNVKAEGKTGAARFSAALLTWVTSREINSERFEIERSSTGKTWEKIGDLPAQTLSSELLDYSFTDPNPSSNTVYYRLKMIDADGTFAYSRIETLKFGNAEIVVYPNPVEAGKSLQVLLNDRQISKVMIYDLVGKQVYESESGAPQMAQVNVRNLPAGRYVLKIRLVDGSESSHMIVKR